MRLRVLRPFIFSTSLLFLSSCGLNITISDLINLGIWGFDDEAQYTYDSNQVEIVNSKARLKVVDTQHSGTDFNSGTHVGTYLLGNQVSLFTDKTSDSLNVNTILPNLSNYLII